MKRPYLVHFTAIQNPQYLAIKASVSLKKFEEAPAKVTILEGSVQRAASSPLESLSLIWKNRFTLKILIRDEKNNIILQKDFDTDDYGILITKIENEDFRHRNIKIFIYEISLLKGLNLLMGSFLPTKLEDDFNLIVTDFDKTLVDTKYSTIKEVYHSLSKPIEYFPPVNNSIQLLNQLNLETESAHTFILSASPHFYEKAIRDWLYQRKIYSNHIFLKDYRKIFNFRDETLGTKDMKAQGFYKLGQIVSILNLTTIPSELILIGDGFESDRVIYLILYAVLVDRVDPWMVWDKIKKDKHFKFNLIQDSQFLTLFSNLRNLLGQKKIKVKIYIRATHENLDELKNSKFDFNFLEQNKEKVNYYLGND